MKTNLSQTRIKNLNLYMNYAVGHKKDLENLFKELINSSVEILDLGSTHIQSLEPLKNTLNQTNIKTLRLGWNHEIGNNGFTDLCEALIDSSVEVLDLSDCNITSLESIKSTLNRTNIKTLNLAGNEIGNQGWEDLCEALINSSVEILNLKRCGINSKQVKESLDEIMGQTKLQMINEIAVELTTEQKNQRNKSIFSQN